MSAGRGAGTIDNVPRPRSTPDPTVFARPVLPLIATLQQMGVDPGPVFERADISSEHLGDPNLRLRRSQIDTLWSAAYEQSGDPALALRAGTAFRFQNVGTLGYLARASESPRNAWERVEPHFSVFCDGAQCALETVGRDAVFRWKTLGGASSRPNIEFWVAAVVTVARSFLGGFEPREVRFAYPPLDYADEYERVLKVRVRFDALAYEVVVPACALDRPSPDADAKLAALMERQAGIELARLPRSNRLRDLVRCRIADELTSHRLSAPRIASAVGLSPRTLRRQLCEEGTTYQRLLDEVRHELARDYFARDGRDAAEVAALLGFADASAFRKAFQRWTGNPPA